MDIKEQTARKLFNRLFQQISYTGEEYEQKSKLYWLLEDKYNISKTAVIADQELTLDERQWKELAQDIKLLKSGHPVQHLTNKSDFYGYNFFVNDQVLIPRPETEELVDLIIKENKDHQHLKILDVGAGSGCIPIVLNLELEDPTVWSIDISENAVEVAKRNNALLKSHVNFFVHDIFSSSKVLPQVNILVSNPPYVPVFEKEGMQKEVFNYEPHVALFAPAEDVLSFYRRVAEVGKSKLLKEGRIYFEIHENYGQETATVMEEMGYQNVEIFKDIHHKDRIIRGKK